MNVLISSSAASLDAPVDPRFGRAALFILWDSETGEWRAVDNGEGLDALSGAGTQAARIAAELDVQAVITGHCGPKAFRALSAAGITVYTGAEGTVAEALEQLGRGKLQQVRAADVDGHG